MNCSRFSDAFDCADLTAAQAVANGFVAVRAAAAGTVSVKIGDNTRVLRLTAGETIEIPFSRVEAATGSFPITLYKGV